MSDARTVALVSLVAVAPLAICVIVAMLRGYTISVHLTREGQRRGRNDPND
jgi:hypothetical protein